MDREEAPKGDDNDANNDTCVPFREESELTIDDFIGDVMYDFRVGLMFG
jgi:hypothetical protein